MTIHQESAQFHKASRRNVIDNMFSQDLDEEDRQRITSRINGQRVNRKRRLNPVKASLRRVGDAFNGSKSYAKEKVRLLMYHFLHTVIGFEQNSAMHVRWYGLQTCFERSQTFLVTNLPFRQ